MLEGLNITRPRFSKRQKWSKQTRRNFVVAMLFLMPWFLGFLAFTLYPMGASLVYSFAEYHSKKPLEALVYFAELKTPSLPFFHYAKIKEIKSADYLELEKLKLSDITKRVVKKLAEDNYL